MTVHYLDKVFNPHTVAVIGASDRPKSIGMKVFNNLLQNGFLGHLFAVNPKHKKVQGQPCYASIKNISETIDLAVIVTPASTITRIIKQCGEQKVRSVLILSAGFSETNQQGATLEHNVLELARHYNMRIIGPNCLGIMRPHLKLNATFSNNNALPGNIALISQSGALCASILDWAIEQQIGFSAIVSLGNAADVDFGDVLDYFASDIQTQSILLYIEGIHNARSFMSGLRAASRLKPVVAIKTGRHLQGSRAAISHTGAIIGNDDVFDVALHRAGAVRVNTIEQLFNAAQILSGNSRTKGNRLCIVTNGGGAGVMAADRAAELNIKTPELSEATLTQLGKILPENASLHNPIDILGDATPARYQQVLNTCLSDDNIDGLLAILVPVVMSEPIKVAEKIVTLHQQSTKPILAAWMGQRQVKSSWKLFTKAKVPYFSTPEAAIEAFAYLASYQFNQLLLMEVPGPLTHPIKPDINSARLIIESALAEHRKILTTIESKAVLSAFGIPVTQTIHVDTADGALNAAQSIGFPIVMKINSPDISHKQEVGGVQLNITNKEAVLQTYQKIINNAKQKRPEAKINGVTIERMYKNSNDRELMVGVLRDSVFGPIISFGAGGSIVEVMQDRAVALPPLNQFIARKLISQTRVAKLLDAFRGMPAVNISAIENMLLRVSEMVCELPQIREMDINPLIANDQEVIAVDARIVVDHPPNESIPYSHMAIHPYPRHFISEFQLVDGTTITIRPVRPEDARLEQEFTANLSARSKYFRFMENLRELTPQMLVRFTQIDYDREMALIATFTGTTKETAVGVARFITFPDQQTCEFALVVADNWQNKGIGSNLMNRLIEIAKNKGLKSMMGEILADNTNMLTLVQNLGFIIGNSRDPNIKIANKLLV